MREMLLRKGILGDSNDYDGNMEMDDELGRVGMLRFGG
jgi:hypothetical protein